MDNDRKATVKYMKIYHNNLKTIIMTICLTILLSACNNDVIQREVEPIQAEHTTETSSPTEYELFSLSPSDYAYIVTANGKTGERIRWDDAETVQLMTDRLNGFRYTQTDDTVLEGWTAQISFYSAEDVKLLSVVISPNEVRYDQMRYLRTSPEGDEYFDEAFLLQYFNCQY